ncbi:NAD(P)H-dependent oxidoreductase subunit E [Gudongella sp. DL1XJH-153]|uniref:NADH-quinone oxidoreductase subunit NuoE family protein n=1 Tax=Gudongella sp. DL1XJH-153 TaxID=3409804 RepID=UPI003BB75D40
MMTRTLSQDLYDQLEAYIDSIESTEAALIEVLHEAQHIFGYLPMEVQLFIGEKLHVPASKVFGVVSFYSYFTTEPKGKYVINICTGTACFVRNAEAIVREFEKTLNIKTGETTGNKMYTIDCLRCVGACGLAPVVMVNDDVYGKVTVDDVYKIIAKYTE